MGKGGLLQRATYFGDTKLTADEVIFLVIAALTVVLALAFLVQSLRESGLKGRRRRGHRARTAPGTISRSASITPMPNRRHSCTTPPTKPALSRRNSWGDPASIRSSGSEESVDPPPLRRSLSWSDETGQPLARAAEAGKDPQNWPEFRERRDLAATDRESFGRRRVPASKRVSSSSAPAPPSLTRRHSWEGSSPPGSHAGPAQPSAALWAPRAVGMQTAPPLPAAADWPKPPRPVRQGSTEQLDRLPVGLGGWRGNGAAGRDDDAASDTNATTAALAAGAAAILAGAAAADAEAERSAAHVPAPARPPPDGGVGPRGGDGGRFGGAANGGGGAAADLRGAGGGASCGGSMRGPTDVAREERSRERQQHHYAREAVASGPPATSETSAQIGARDDDAPGAWAWAERSARLAADDGSRIGDAGNNGGRMAEWLQLD